MRSEALNKHQAKSEATRAILLDSAQKIFFRDGFERAQISEIARVAGRTSGAIYAQFENKEHLFLAVLERRMQEIADLGRGIIEQETAANPHLRLQAFRKYYTALYKPDWAILDIELKLYALRHPESMEKLKSISRRVWKGQHEGLYHGENRSLKSKIESRIAVLGPVASAIVLSMQWEPRVMSLKQARLILGEIFDGLFGQDGVSVPTLAQPEDAIKSDVTARTPKTTRRKR